MSSAVFWKSPQWRHLNAVPQVNCSTRLVHWQQNSCHRRLFVCAEQTAGTRWLIADVNGRSSTVVAVLRQTSRSHGGTWRPERLSYWLTGGSTEQGTECDIYDWLVRFGSAGIRNDREWRMRELGVFLWCWVQVMELISSCGMGEGIGCR